MTSAKFNVCALRNSTQAMASSRIYNTAGQSLLFSHSGLSSTKIRSIHPLFCFLFFSHAETRRRADHTVKGRERDGCGMRKMKEENRRE